MSHSPDESAEERQGRLEAEAEAEFEAEQAKLSRIAASSKPGAEKPRGIRGFIQRFLGHGVAKMTTPSDWFD